MSHSSRRPLPGSRRPLPGSEDEPPRSRVAEIQRARLLAAASEAFQEVGYAAMSVAEIVGRAGVSRKTFYEAFSDREDCLLALLEETVAQAGKLAGDAFRAAPHWRAGVRSGLAALLALMDSEPALARLWTLDSLGGGERVLEKRAEVLAALADVLDRGRTAANTRYDPPEIVAVGLTGGVLEVVRTRLGRAPTEPLTNLLGPLMYMITLPYLGERVARNELSKPPPDVVRGAPSSGSVRDQLGGLRMRLTYRTMRTLLAIDRCPGASNREVAHAAGIADQGQVSKLLNRLARLELIENRGLGQKQRGAANAWWLTRRGEQLARTATEVRFGLGVSAAGAVE